jgi:VanZ family protein
VRRTIPPHQTPGVEPAVLIRDVFPAAAYVGVIFYTGLIRLGKLPEVGFVATDKLLHALVFGGLAILLARAARVLLPGMPVPKRLAVAVLGASFLGALLEVCQLLVSYRSAEFLDWLADTVGAVGAAGLCALYVQLTSRRAHG